MQRLGCENYTHGVYIRRVEHHWRVDNNWHYFNIPVIARYPLHVKTLPQDNPTVNVQRREKHKIFHYSAVKIPRAPAPSNKTLEKQILAMPLLPTYLHPVMYLQVTLHCIAIRRPWAKHIPIRPWRLYRFPKLLKERINFPWKLGRKMRPFILYLTLYTVPLTWHFPVDHHNTVSVSPTRLQGLHEKTIWPQGSTPSPLKRQTRIHFRRRWDKMQKKHLGS